jgi:hypothetical protein
MRWKSNGKTHHGITLYDIKILVGRRQSTILTMFGENLFIRLGAERHRPHRKLRRRQILPATDPWTKRRNPAQKKSEVNWHMISHSAKQTQMDEHTGNRGKAILHLQTISRATQWCLESRQSSKTTSQQKTSHQLVHEWISFLSATHRTKSFLGSHAKAQLLPWPQKKRGTIIRDCTSEFRFHRKSTTHKSF